MSAQKKAPQQRKKHGFSLLMAGIICVFGFAVFALATGETENASIDGNAIRSAFLLEKGHGIVTNIWFENASRMDEWKAGNVKYLIVDVGNTGANGKIETPDQEIKDFLSFITSWEKQKNYNFIMLAYSEVNTENYNFDSADFRKNLIADYVKWNAMGFEGVLVDVEPIQFSQRTMYLDFLGSIRNSFPRSAVLSVYTGHLGTSFTNEWEWTAQYFQKVSNYVQLMSVPGYDIELKTKSAYQKNIRTKIQKLSTLALNAQVIFAIPTHKAAPETIQNALEVYVPERQKYNDTKFVGTVIFAEWTTDGREWEIFRSFTKQ